MIDFFYDTEFIEDGVTIELISIGIVSSRGHQYYAINRDIEENDHLHYKIVKHRWLVENVVRHLPLLEYSPPERKIFEDRGTFTLDILNPVVKFRDDIAKEVRKFLLQYNEPIRLWAYYGAYDHIVLSQLWGKMLDRPKGIPMFTHDLMQFASSLGLDDSHFPHQEGTQHNALDDAYWNKYVWEYLNAKSIERNMVD